MAHISAVSPSPQDSDDGLLQPCTKLHKLHPLTLIGEYIFSFIITDPDTMSIKEALQ